MKGGHGCTSGFEEKGYCRDEGEHSQRHLEESILNVISQLSQVQ